MHTTLTHEAAACTPIAVPSLHEPGEESHKPAALAALSLSALDLMMCSRVALVRERAWDPESLAEVALSHGWAGRVASAVEIALDLHWDRAMDLGEILLAAAPELMRHPKSRRLATALLAYEKGETHDLSAPADLEALEAITATLDYPSGSREHRLCWIDAFDIAVSIAVIVDGDVETISRWGCRVLDEIALRRGM